MRPRAELGFSLREFKKGMLALRNTSPTVEVTAPSRPFAVINNSEQTHECCGNGFNLGGKMSSKRITAKDHLKSKQHCKSIADGSRSRSQ
ncbi:hypothetical protein H5410_030007 [Solanum commersonii]|uniref:Uncharacterized protein n=1 Tax=Solanum commersonii TaxID=4109 RepID=A0A9J5YEW2_SOLCO|nr:hypothetical protein H5410_030007 [Solanum commersonii]